MQMTAEQPLQHAEELRSFDISASVKKLRYDLHNFNEILPETRQQVLNEELSFVVEGLGRQSRTSFILKREGNSLVYFNHGEWCNYSGLISNGIKAAENEAKSDFRKGFLVDMAYRDEQKATAMRDLNPGQKLTWTSPYDHETAQIYGSEFMNSCGQSSDRKLGFVYQASCLEDGNILLESQTLDKSDIDGFNKIDTAIKDNSEIGLDELVEIYDATLTNKFGGEFRAGQTELYDNTWDWVLEQSYLKTYLISELEQIAAGPLTGEQLDLASKKHIYGVWAAYKKRLDGLNYSPKVFNRISGLALSDRANQWAIRQEVNFAFKDFVNKEHIMVGCGGSVKISKNEDDILSYDPSDVFASVFGGKDCPEVKNGQKTNCPHCKKRVTAIVPDRKTIYCSNDECKLAAPGLIKIARKRRSGTH